MAELPPEFSCGVYYGWARVGCGPVHKMVMSVGWNPHYQNKKKSMVRKGQGERRELCLIDTFFRLIGDSYSS